MEEKIIEKMQKLFDQKNPGYAYIYPQESEQWDERCFLSLTPKNIANFINDRAFTAQKITMTDMLDRLVCESIYGGFLFNCPDQSLCKEIVEELAPLQMGEKEPEEVVLDIEALSTPATSPDTEDTNIVDNPKKSKENNISEDIEIT